MTEGNQTVMANFPPAALETEGSVQPRKQRRHAILRRSRSGANYGFEVRRNSYLIEGNQTVMVRFPPAALETEGSFQSQKQRRHAILRGPRSDANYGFEVQGNSDLIEGNHKNMASLLPTAIETEALFRSQKWEKHATLRRSRSDTSYGLGVQRNSNSTEENCGKQWTVCLLLLCKWNRRFDIRNKKNMQLFEDQGQMPVTALESNGILT